MRIYRFLSVVYISLFLSFYANAQDFDKARYKVIMSDKNVNCAAYLTEAITLAQKRESDDGGYQMVTYNAQSILDNHVETLKEKYSDNNIELDKALGVLFDKYDKIIAGYPKDSLKFFNKYADKVKALHCSN